MLYIGDQTAITNILSMNQTHYCCAINLDPNSTEEPHASVKQHKKTPVVQTGVNDIFLLFRQDSLHQHHLPHARVRLTGIGDRYSFKSIVVHTAGDHSSVPLHRSETGLLNPFDERRDDLSQHIVNSQRDSAVYWQLVIDAGQRIERIGMVLLQGEGRWPSEAAR